MPLAWHSAAAFHRQALQQFVCTDPEKREYDRYRGSHHPRPWELEVQSHIRGLKVPRNRDEKLLVGLDDHGVAAAIHFGLDDSGDHFQIWALATALRSRRAGLACQAMDQAIAVLVRTREAFGRDSMGLFCFVDPRNEASRGLLVRFGFEYLEMYDGYHGMVLEV